MTRVFPRIAAWLCVSLATVVAQGAPRPDDAVARPAYASDRVLVKLREDSGAVWRDGRLESRGGADLAAVAAVFAGARHVERAITLPLDLLDRWHREADERLPPGRVRPGHLGLWFRLHAADDAHGEALLAALAPLDAVESAELEPIPYPAGGAVPAPPEDLPPATPDFTPQQDYKGPPPVGVGCELARSIVGGRGRGLRLVQVEADWVWNHEDLDAIGLGSFIGVPTPGNTSNANHGTGVAGVLVGGRNGYGVTGMVEEIDMRLVGWFENGGIPNAIALATQNASAGDVVLLIAMYQLAQTNPDDWVPAEYFQINFDAILTATARGIVFVEAVGNGGSDFDDPRFARRFDLAYRDSGAIFVGATDGRALRRASFSSYGSRLDTNGWGDEVTTTGYGGAFRPNDDPRQFYTHGYAGTSSASAMVGGVVASLVAAVRYQDGRLLRSEEVRSLLRRHGTAVTGSIGRRPDLRAMLADLGLPDALSVDRQEVDRGAAFTITMGGAAGDGMALLLSPVLATTDLGFNRPLHLELASLLDLGIFALTGSSASFRIDVPDDPALAGLDVFVQGVRVRGTALHVTSSCEVHVR